MERVRAEGVGRIAGGLWRLTVINVDQLAPLGVWEAGDCGGAAPLGTSVTSSQKTPAAELM